MPPLADAPSSPADHGARYDRVAVALHWAMAALLIAQVGLGWWMLDLPKQPAGLRAGWFNLHKSLGLLLGALVLCRLGWRVTHRPPPWSEAVARWQQQAATVVHGVLYAALVVMPLSGYLGSSFSGHPVRAFGVALPQWTAPWPAAKAAMSAVHQASAWALIAALSLHVAAAAWHAGRRDGVLRRMTWKGRPR